MTLNIAGTGQSDTRKASEQPLAAEALIAAAVTLAGEQAALEAADRGFSPADEYAVINIDPRGGGVATLELLRLTEDFPKSARGQTHGGRRAHYFYRLPPGVAVRAGSVALGTGLALKYVPGSAIDARRYAWTNDRPVVAAPQWLIDRISADTQSPQHMTDTTAPAAPAAATATCINSNQTDDNMQARDAGNSDARVQAATKSAAPTPNTDLSLWGQETTVPESKSAAVARAGEWIFSEDSPNAEGDGQYDTAINVAVRVCGFGVNREEAVELLSDWNTLACTPGLCSADIQSAVQTAYSDRQRDGSTELTPHEAAKHASGAASAASIPPSSKLEAALDAARRGFSVFPLKHYAPPTEDTAEAREHAIKEAKKPVSGFDKWEYRATTDEQQIGEWWTRYPNANIGGVTHGLLVVDVDPKNGGDDTYAELSLTNAFPNTLRTKTPSGGSHNIYALPPHVHVGNSPPGKLGPGIDIKSAVSYIVLPGSSYEGRPYEWANDRPMAIAPEWVLAACKKPKPKSTNAGRRVVEEDETSIELAEKYLTHRAPEANEGTRNNTAVGVANGFYDYGVSKETCVDFLLRWNETRCFPPLGDAAELEQVAASAPGSRSKPIGCSHPLAPGFTDESQNMEPLTPAQQERQEIWKAQTEREAQQAREAKSRPKFYYVRADAGAKRATLNPGEPLIKGIIHRGAMSVLIGAPGGGKTFFVLDWCHHIAKGLPWNGKQVHQGAVVYLAAEAGNMIMARLAALEAHYGPLGDAPLFVVPCPADFAHGMEDAETILALIKDVEAKSGHKVELFVVDTLARAISGGDENSSKDMGALIKAVDYIRDQAKTHALIIHHPGKDEGKGGRGHSNVLGGTDTEMVISNHVLKFTKQRDMLKGEPVAFSLEPIRIGTDKEGAEVTSCYVQIRQKGEPQEQHPLSLEQMGWLEAIDAALGDIPTKPFDRKFATNCMTESGSVTPLARTTVTTRLTELTESGYLAKPAVGQWVRVVTESDGK